MSDVNINIDNALLIERRLAEACNGCKAGSPELKIKVNKILNELFDEGTLLTPGEWVSPFEVKVQLPGDVKEINITCDFH